MRFKVTQTHIDLGQWTNPLHSPITLALKEAGFKSVLVYRDNIRIGNHKILFTERITLCVMNEKPFEFEIKIPLRIKQCLSK